MLPQTITSPGLQGACGRGRKPGPKDQVSGGRAGAIWEARGAKALNLPTLPSPLGGWPAAGVAEETPRARVTAPPQEQPHSQHWLETEGPRPAPLGAPQVRTHTWPAPGLPQDAPAQVSCLSPVFCTGHRQ